MLLGRHVKVVQSLTSRPPPVSLQLPQLAQLWCSSGSSGGSSSGGSSSSSRRGRSSTNQPRPPGIEPLASPPRAGAWHAALPGAPVQRPGLWRRQHAEQGVGGLPAGQRLRQASALLFCTLALLRLRSSWPQSSNAAGGLLHGRRIWYGPGPVFRRVASCIGP